MVIGKYVLLIGMIGCASCSPRIGITLPGEKIVSRGTQWVRSHPFHLSALSSWADGKLWDADQYRGGGFNTLMVWDPWKTLFQRSADAGLPFHYNVHHRHGETPEDYVQHVRKIVEKYPGCTGLLVHDEPVLWQLEKVRKVCDALKQAFPEILVYSNALPMGARRATKYGFETEENAPEDFYNVYFDQFAEVVNGDVLMVDIYPINTGHSPLYFSNLEIVRRKGLELGIPYWLFIQSWDRGGDGKPSESDLRFQLFALLAYGFKGISYFTYEPLRGTGLTDGESQPTELYYHAARANREVGNLGQTLRFLVSSGVGFVAGRHGHDGQVYSHPIPSGMRSWDSLPTRPRQLLGITLEDQGRGKDAIFATFEDDQGHDYFMVVNLWHHHKMSSAQTAQSVSLHFNPKVKSVTRLSRETAMRETLVVRNGVLQLKLSGGTGDLFKLHDEPFPGL